VRKELRRGGNSVSFFAFQDIITSVIGVVLFIALLLALFIAVNRPVLEVDEPARQEASQEDLDRLNNLLAELVSLENELRLAKSANNASSQIEIDTLRRELQQILEQIASVQSSGPQSSTAHEIQAELSGLERDLNRLLARVKEVESRLAQRRSDVQVLEEKLEQALQAKLQEEGRKNDIFLIPQKEQSTKSPILLDVKKSAISLQTLDGQSVVAKSSSSGDLKQLLEGFPRTDYYVVAYFRPSTFHLSEQVLKTIRSLDYELGYDVLRDDQNVALGNPQ
jgi:hypothetical protein